MDAIYPGGNAKPEEILRLANEYRAAAQHLFAQRRKGEAISLAPCRLTAIHAIELYLNAHLTLAGFTAKDIRTLGHDLAKRAKSAADNGLILRKLTVAHLNDLTNSRDYLEARYDPGMTKTQMNRLLATLEEVQGKVAANAISTKAKVAVVLVPSTLRKMAAEPA